MSNLPIFEVRPSPVRATDTDILILGQESKGPGKTMGPYAGTVQKLRKSESFTAKLGATAFLRFGGKGGAQNALLVGLGTPKDLDAEKFRQAGGHAWNKIVSEKCKSASIRVDQFDVGPTEVADAVRAFAEGLILGAYEFKKYKTQKEAAEARPSVRVTFVAKDKALKSALEKDLKQVSAIGEAVSITRDWSNEPSNEGTPEYYAAEARKLAKEHGLKCTVLTEADAAKEKMGLFLGVGQGAEREGRIVIVEYVPKAAGSGAVKTLALVGKGVTFDSGGISIKPALRMEEMKHDMTGAATVMGAVVLAARWKVPNRVIGVMAFTENMPSGNAIQPGNVLRSRSGQTVEIINTDAEGRLVLGDALDYAQDFKPDAVVDVATLTGAVSIALGKYCCAILGNDEDLITRVRQAGARGGERIWQLPLYDDYFEDLKSETADMKNSANDSYGGTIRGAIFLKQFIRKGVPWAHLDIAATATGLTHLSYYPKRGASGAYVRALAQLAGDF